MNLQTHHPYGKESRTSFATDQTKNSSGEAQGEYQAIADASAQVGKFRQLQALSDRFVQAQGYSKQTGMPSSRSQVIQGVFKAADFNIVVGNSERDILMRALETVMESPIYLQLAATIRDEGGITIQYADDTEAPAFWRSSDRTIYLNPNKIQQARMVVASILAFELANASQDQAFKKLLQRVKQGEVKSPKEYGMEAEKIEWNSAKIRAQAAMEMIKAGRWNRHNDPQLRHFIPLGESIQYGWHQTIVGDGAWLTFEGFYDTQVKVGHTAGHEARFLILAPQPLQQELKHDSARERFLERKRLKEENEQKSTAPQQVEDKKSKLITTTDPSSFLDGTDLERFWQEKGRGKPYLGKNGKMYRLTFQMEGTFYFKEVA